MITYTLYHICEMNANIILINLKNILYRLTFYTFFQRLMIPQLLYIFIRFYIYSPLFLYKCVLEWFLCILVLLVPFGINVAYKSNMSDLQKVGSSNNTNILIVLLIFYMIILHI